jgi:hypothetical protein
VTDKEQFLNELRGIQRIVINDCYGGFGLSDAAISKYKEMAGITANDFHDRDVPRDDPYLVKIVKEMGSLANGGYANLKIVEVPGDVDWIIQEYDGAEWVAERHRTWS